MEALEFYIGELEDALNRVKKHDTVDPAGPLPMNLVEALLSLVTAAEQTIIAYDAAAGNTPAEEGDVTE